MNNPIDTLPHAEPNQPISSLQAVTHEYNEQKTANISPADIQRVQREVDEYQALRRVFLDHYDTQQIEFKISLSRWKVLEYWLSKFTHPELAMYVDNIVEEAAQRAVERFTFTREDLVNPPAMVVNSLTPNEINHEYIRGCASYYRQRVYRQRILLSLLGYICSNPIEVFAVDETNDLYAKSGAGFWKGLNLRLEKLDVSKMQISDRQKYLFNKVYLEPLPEACQDYLTGAYMFTSESLYTSQHSGSKFQTRIPAAFSKPSSHQQSEQSDDRGFDPPENGMNEPDQTSDNSYPLHPPPGPPGPVKESDGSWSPPHPAYRPPIYLAAAFEDPPMQSVEDEDENREDAAATMKSRVPKGQQRTNLDIKKKPFIVETSQGPQCVFPIGREEIQIRMRGPGGSGGVENQIPDGQGRVPCGKVMKRGENNLLRHTYQHLCLGVYCPEPSSKDDTCNFGPRTRQDKIQEHWAEKHGDLVEYPRPLVFNFIVALGRMRTIKPNWISSIYWSRGDNMRGLRREDNNSRPELDVRRQIQRKDLYKYALWILLSSGQHCSHVGRTIEIIQTDTEKALGTQHARVMREIEYLEKLKLRHTPFQLWSGRRCIYGKGVFKQYMNMSCLGQTIAPPGNRATVNALKVPQPLALDELKKKLRRSKGQAERNASEPPEDPLQVPTAPNDDLRDPTGEILLITQIREAKREEYEDRLKSPPSCDSQYDPYCQSCFRQEEEKTLPFKLDKQLQMDYWPLPPGEIFHVDIWHNLHYFVDRSKGHLEFWCQSMHDGSVREYHPDTLMYGPDGTEGEHDFRQYYLQNMAQHGQAYRYRVDMAHHQVNQARISWVNYNEALKTNNRDTLQAGENHVRYCLKMAHRWVAYSQPLLGSYHPEALNAVSHGDEVMIPPNDQIPFRKWWEHNDHQELILTEQLHKAEQDGERPPPPPVFVNALPTSAEVAPVGPGTADSLSIGAEPPVHKRPAGNMRFQDTTHITPTSMRVVRDPVPQVSKPQRHAPVQEPLGDLGLIQHFNEQQSSHGGPTNPPSAELELERLRMLQSPTTNVKFQNFAMKDISMLSPQNTETGQVNAQIPNDLPVKKFAISQNDFNTKTDKVKNQPESEGMEGLLYEGCDNLGHNFAAPDLDFAVLPNTNLDRTSTGFEMDLDPVTFSNVFNNNFTSLNNPLPFGLIDGDSISPDTVDNELLTQLLPMPEESGGVANLDQPPVSMPGQNTNGGAQSEFTNTSEHAATGGIAGGLPLDFSALTDDDWAQVLDADNLFSGPVEISAPQTLDDKDFWYMLK